MEELIDFLKRVLTSIGLKYTEDGYVQIEADGSDSPVLLCGKSLVLPTQENINTMVGTGESGENEVLKLPFNPIYEDSVKGDTKCFQWLRIYMEKRISHTVAGLGELLLTMASDKSLQTKTTTAINKFLMSINDAKTPHNSTGRNKLIDVKTVENWLKLYTSYALKPVGLVSITVKKSGKIDGVKYNRVATLISDLYDVLLEATADTPVNGVKLRNKDIAVFKLLIEFMLDGIKDNQSIYEASMDSEHPAFISLTKLYIKIMNKLMPMVKVLKNINPETGDSAYLEISITEDELDNLGIYKPFLLTLPEEFDLIGNSNKKANKLPSIDVNTINNSPSLSAPAIVSNNPILNDAVRASQTVIAEPSKAVSNTTSKMQKLEEMEKELELEKKMLELEKQKAEISNMRQGISTGSYNSLTPRQPNNIDENDPVIAAGRSIGSPMSRAMYGNSYVGSQYPDYGSRYPNQHQGYGVGTYSGSGYVSSSYNRYAYPAGRTTMFRR